MAPRSTADRILNVAERLVQAKGFNGFSYADIATEVRIQKASLHYHFPSKSELGRRLIERYHATVLAALADIDRTGGSALAKLERYVALYAAVLAKGRICLCGMLAAEFSTLPKPMREGVRTFFAANEAWVAKVIDEGVAAHELRVSGASAAAAALLVSSIEGAMILARAAGDPARFTGATTKLLGNLAARA